MIHLGPIPASATVYALTWEDASRYHGRLRVDHRDGTASTLPTSCWAELFEYAEGEKRQVVAHCPHLDTWYASPVRWAAEAT